VLQVLEREEVINLVKKFAQELLKAGLISIKEIYVYGSYTRGNPDIWSDIDVAIIVNENLKPDELINIEARLRRLARKIDIRIEPVIFSSDPLGFLESEVKSGIRIYPEVTDDKV